MEEEKYGRMRIDQAIRAGEWVSGSSLKTTVIILITRDKGCYFAEAMLRHPGLDPGSRDNR